MSHPSAALIVSLALAGVLALPAPARAQAGGTPPQGELKGSAWVHTAASLSAAVANAAVVLPAAATGGAVYVGKWADAPVGVARVPVVVFLHGSSGLGLKAIGEWQQWLATLGVASVAPDSFALPDRVTYSSPIGKDAYERIHALRASEIVAAATALRQATWADPARWILAGTSEGSVAVARHPGSEFAGRMLFAWSCEANYFVEAPRNAFEAGKPVLNVISTVDPFFSPTNTWLGNPQAKGHCGDALQGNPRAKVVLVPGAPHTLINLPMAREATAGLLSGFTRP